MYFNVPVAYLTGDIDDPSDRSLTHWGEIVYDQKENSPTDPKVDEAIPGYSDLNAANKAKVDEYIALLLSSQQNE